MDLDPSLSLTAEGLWSDEESSQNPNSDAEDPDYIPPNQQPPKRKVFPHKLPLIVGPSKKT